MPKNFVVNGRKLICVEDSSFEDIKKMFKPDVTIDDLLDWELKDIMQKYTAQVFIEKSRHYLSQSPPDLVQAAEKIWFAAVYSVKELFLKCGGIDVKSHKSLTYFCKFALEHAAVSNKTLLQLYDSWGKAERMHRDVYGAENYRHSDYVQIITDVEFFVNEFEKFDRGLLFIKFKEMFIDGKESDVVIREVNNSVNLGGVRYQSKYTVFVP